MALLTEAGSGPAYLRAGFLGFQKSGKTFTAADLAIGTWELFGKKGRIAMFDTEGGSDYLKKRIFEKTGQKLLQIKSQSFSDLMSVTKEIGQDWVLIVDSVTHIWRELCEGHLKGINEMRERRGLSPRKNLEFQDYNPLKQKWAEWTKWYLNHPSHNIICGRAGYEYDMEKDEETGKSNLVKTGVKMKTEGEFGFEPSLLVEMERVTVLEPTTKLIHRATVIGDRFNLMDGAVCDNPTFDFFKPHIEALMEGEHVPIDTEVKTDTGSAQDGDAEWARERKTRQILCEEIQGVMTTAYPGQTAAEKKAKVELLESAFGTKSWTAVESLDSAKLRAGLKKVKELTAEVTQ